MSRRTPSASLRRKAARLHRQANDARANGRTWDAAQLRTRALGLEQRAEVLDATREPDTGAGFDDADLAGCAGYTAQPRSLFT